jgi:hypothetical protein
MTVSKKIFKTSYKTISSVILPAMVLSLGLFACIPTQETRKPLKPPVESGVVGGETSFYPNAAGLTWQYIKESNSADAPKYKLEVLGPSLFHGKTLTAIRFVGNASDQTYFREFSSTGVKLYGFSISQTGDVTFEPPIQEYPASSELKIGATWSGQTTVTEPNLADKTKPKSYPISYTYTVLARQQFKIGENVYDTFRIAYEVIASPTERTTQTIHFTPSIGEVRTKEGLLLLGKNF